MKKACLGPSGEFGPPPPDRLEVGGEKLESAKVATTGLKPGVPASVQCQ